MVVAVIGRTDDPSVLSDRPDHQGAACGGRAAPTHAHAPEAFYERHVGAIYADLARRVGPDLGEKLTAQVFLEALCADERFDRIQGRDQAWIAHNVLRKHHRQEARRRRAVQRLGERAGDDGGGHEAAVAERDSAERSRDRVDAALAAMSPGEREVLLLHGWADLTYVDVAAALGLPEGTVRSRLNRARFRLSAALGPSVRDDLRGTA